MTDTNVGPNAAIMTMTDRIAKYVKDFKEGTSGITGGTDLWDTVDGSGDVNFENKLKGSQISSLDTTMKTTYLGNQFTTLYQLLAQYARSDLSLSTFNTMLSTYGFRVHEYYADAYEDSLNVALSAANIFADQDKSANDLGNVSYDATGAKTYTIENGGTLSSSLGPTSWVAKVTDAIGATNVTFTASWYIDASNSTTATLSYVIPASTSLNATVNLGEMTVTTPGEDLVSGETCTITVASPTAPDTTANMVTEDMYLLITGDDASGNTIQEIVQTASTSAVAGDVITLQSTEIINADTFDSNVKVYPLMHGIESVSDSSTGATADDAFDVLPREDRTPAY